MHLKLLFAAAVAVLGWLRFVEAANCNTFTSQPDCDAVGGCYWTNSKCICASNVTMDVVFTLDASGSIGSSSFQVALQWMEEIIGTSLTRSSRVGIIRFATSSDLLLTLVQSEQYTRDGLEKFVSDIYYTGGYTNTVAALEQLMSLFSAQGNPYASWVNILITDGNPYLPGGDTDVCSRASRMKAMGITTIIIGVGSQWNPANVDCLVASPSDIIYVTSYTSGQLNTILPTLTKVTCPVTYNLIISEVQLDLVSSSEGSRFVEAYNPSTTVTLKDLDMDGIFEGKIATDSSLTLPQASYLVLYDKNAPTMISCEDCKCTKGSNNLCTDAVYVPCCSSGCACSFGGSSMSNTDWHISFIDLTNKLEVDGVTYDNSSWPQIMVGYSYSLKYVGYDNQLGSNWEQSCNTRGTPGSYPITNCSWTCTDQQCRLNGASSATCVGSGSTQKCDCNSNSYYFADRTCNTVPPPGTCYASWIKNDTTNARYVEFEWVAAATDRQHKYMLNYYTRAGTADSIITSSRTKTVSDYDYSRGPYVVAGTVQTQIGTNGSVAYSSTVDCYPVTMSPTAAPTFAPPYIYVAGDICSEDRCSCAEKNPYNCTGAEIEKDFSADDTKLQFVTIRRMPEAYDHDVTVFWEIWLDANYVANTTTNATKTTSRRQLLAVNGTNSTSNGTQGIGIYPTSGVVTFNTSGYEEKIGFKIQKQVAAPGENKYKWYVLNVTKCNSSIDRDECTPVYPSVLRMKVDITGGGDAFTETKTQKEMPKWLWWLIGGLVIFAAILAVLGYRYWWKHKQTSEELVETEDQLEHAIEENELGFGKDLGVGDVQFNPMATGVPGQVKAPELFGGEMDKRSKDASNVRADVAVEKFAHREQFGQQQGMKRGNGGNDLSQPLLG